MSSAQQKAALPDGPSLLDAVFGEERKAAESSERRSALLVGLVVALGAHAGLYLVARSKEPSLETWSANVAALVHADLANTAPTEIESASPPRPAPSREPSTPPEPAPEVDEKGARDMTSPTPEPTSAQQSAPAHEAEASMDAAVSPAQAGELIAAEPSGPVDLTDSTFVTGQASSYVGGATARTGRGNKARQVADVERRDTNSVAKSGAPTQKRSSQARPVQLPGGRWSCAWPKAALDQDIYEQYVVLRVHVRSDGSVQDVTLESDPGSGFGPAAMACAKSTRFAPALDEAGNAVAATSPPIRVRFTR